MAHTSLREYKLILAEDDLKQRAMSLLRENNLPVSDLDEEKYLFALLINDEVIGTGGLEFFQDCALLRSVSIKKFLQGNGFGKLITRELEKNYPATRDSMFVPAHNDCKGIFQ